MVGEEGMDMDCEKIGRQIARLRREKGLTQAQAAARLHISPKTVSKWECGMGLPDVSLWPQLSALLGADLARLMAGEMAPNRPDAGNMQRLKFYRCPQCGNILWATGSASIACCARRLEPLIPLKEGDVQVLIEPSDGEYYVTFSHPMTKAHFLSCAMFVRYDQVLVKKFYPEQEASLRLSQLRGGKLYALCTQDGLMEVNIK